MIITNDLPSNLPFQVVELLKEFEDIFPENLRKGLPPIGGIEHQINFIPKAVIPNKPAYRANSEKLRSYNGKWKNYLIKVMS